MTIALVTCTAFWALSPWDFVSTDEAGIRTSSRPVWLALFYVDECGGISMTFSPPPEGKTMTNGSSELFVMSAGGIHDSSRGPLAHELEEAKLRSFSEKAVGDPAADTELKGEYLAHLSRRFAGASSQEVARGYRAVSDKHKFGFLLRDIGQLFAKFRPIVFTVVVDKRDLEAAQEGVKPLRVAYSRLYERVAFTLGIVTMRARVRSSSRTVKMSARSTSRAAPCTRCADRSRREESIGPTSTCCCASPCAQTPRTAHGTARSSS